MVVWIIQLKLLVVACFKAFEWQISNFGWMWLVSPKPGHMQRTLLVSPFPYQVLPHFCLSVGFFFKAYYCFTSLQMLPIEGKEGEEVSRGSPIVGQNTLVGCGMEVIGVRVKGNISYFLL